MLIRLSDEVINLNDLIIVIDFLKVCKGQHCLCILKRNQIEEALKGNFHYLEVFKEQVSASAYGMTFSNTVEVVSVDAIQGQIELSHLYELLSKPAVLILENEHSDIFFLKMVLLSLNSRRLLDKFNSHWEVRGAGGCGEIVKLVTKTIDKLIVSTRITVVHDSDKFFLASPLDRTQTNIINKCRESNVSCVTLKKREIENYIVDEVIISMKDIDTDLKSAYLSLTSIQKDFYDFKNGIKKRAKILHGGLFDNVEPNTIMVLEKGFGKDIAENAFSSDNIHFFSQVNLKNRCRNILAEFRQIESNIRSIL